MVHYIRRITRNTLRWGSGKTVAENGACSAENDDAVLYVWVKKKKKHQEHRAARWEVFRGLATMTARRRFLVGTDANNRYTRFGAGENRARSHLDSSTSRRLYFFFIFFFSLYNLSWTRFSRADFRTIERALPALRGELCIICKLRSLTVFTSVRQSERRRRRGVRIIMRAPEHVVVSDVMYIYNFERRTVFRRSSFESSAFLPPSPSTDSVLSESNYTRYMTTPICGPRYRVLCRVMTYLRRRNRKYSLYEKLRSRAILRYMNGITWPNRVIKRVLIFPFECLYYSQAYELW